MICFTVLTAASCSRDGSDESVTLELWTLALRPTFTDYMTDLCEGFEAQHPGVEVVWVDVPFNGINRKLVAAVAAGHGPDVVNLSDRDFARVAALGGLAGIDELLSAEEMERYLPGARRVLVMDGQTRALPWYLTTSVRLCNEALLAGAGMSAAGLADRWDGLQAQARDYQEHTGGFLFSVPLGESSELPTMMLADGVVPFRETDAGLRADLTKPEVVARVASWVTLYRDGVLPRSAATRDHQAIIEMYQNGQLAVAQTGANMLRRVRDANPDVFADTAVRPAITGNLGRSHVAVMVLGVSSKSQHPELAAKLAAWVTSPENQTELARQSGVLPSTPASLQDSFFDPPEASELESADGMIAQARSISAGALPEAVAFTPAMAAWPDLRRAFGEGIKRALLDGAEVEATLSKIEQEWDAILAAALPAGAEVLPTVEAVVESGAEPVTRRVTAGRETDRVGVGDE
ncbi:MAG: sugar ABC transporter substrate-binding protein [Planctomycetota bacterium]